MRRLLRPILLAPFSLILSFGFSHAYDDVRVDRVIPLVNKKEVPSVLRRSPDGTLWVLMKDQTLQQISFEGKTTRFIKPDKKGAFREPADFCFLHTGDIAMADKGFDAVTIFNPSDVKIKKRIPFDKAAAVAVSHDDIIAIAADGGTFVQIFSIDGLFLHSVFAPEAHAIKSIKALQYSKDGVLWVLDDSKGELHRFSADRKWLGSTTGLEDAQSFTVDDYGYAYVVLAGGRWKEIDKGGEVTGTFGTKGRNPGQLLNPVGVVAEGRDSLFIAEAGNIRLQKFIVDNKEKRQFLTPQPSAFLQVRQENTWLETADAAMINSQGSILLRGTKKAQFKWVDQSGKTISVWAKKKKKEPAVIEPGDMTLDSAGAIWMTDRDDHTIKQVSDTGDILKTVGAKGKQEGSIKDPSFIRIRADGSFVIVDRDNTRVQVLSPNGLFLFALKAKGKGTGTFEHVDGLAINKDRIAFIDNSRKAFLLFDNNGKFLLEIVNKDGKAPVWKDLTGLATDDVGRFYVLDSGSKRIRIFNAVGQFFADVGCSAQRISPIYNNKIVLLGQKDISIQDIHPVSKVVANITADDDDGDIKLSWDSIEGFKQFHVYRASGTAEYELINSSATSPYVDRTVVPSVTYKYAVAAINALGYEGAMSESQPIKAARKKNVSLVSIIGIKFNPVYTAASKYYAKHPIGTVDVQNNNDKPFRDVKISVTLKKYTDYATEVVVPSLGAGEIKSVPVMMTFNDKVIELTEDTPVQVEVRVSYFDENLEKSVTQNGPVTLYSRNAISWADKARISSFVTPKDPPIAEFSRMAVRAFVTELKSATIGRPLAKSILFYESMNALNISYVPDPKNPFSVVSGKPEALDYVQFPRETLSRKTGDCDDTTALLAALLASVGVEVALVDTPGHIFLMANTEESNPEQLGLPVERFVDYNGSYWIPIETTRLGKNFMEAWQSGISEVRAAHDKDQAQFVRIVEAVEEYPPVTILEAEAHATEFPKDAVKTSFTGVLAQLQKEKYDTQIKRVKGLIKSDPENKSYVVELGMVYVEGGKSKEAVDLFNELLKDPSVDIQASAYNNLGNIAYLKGSYSEAVSHYAAAAKLNATDGGIKINQARAAWRMQDDAGAKKYLAEAKEILPEWREFASDMPAELVR